MGNGRAFSLEVVVAVHCTFAFDGVDKAELRYLWQYLTGRAPWTLTHQEAEQLEQRAATHLEALFPWLYRLPKPDNIVDPKVHIPWFAKLKQQYGAMLTVTSLPN